MVKASVAITLTAIPWLFQGTATIFTLNVPAPHPPYGRFQVAYLEEGAVVLWADYVRVGST